MSESFDEYVARIRSYVAGRDPVHVLRATPAALERAIAGVPAKRLTAPRAPGKWSAAQVLAHLADIELLWGYRIRLILEQDGVTLAGMDQDEWARNAEYERIPPRESFELFRALRRANLRLIERLTPAARKRRGLHSQFGELTIPRIAELMAGHDLNPRRQVDEAASPHVKRA